MIFCNVTQKPRIEQFQTLFPNAPEYRRFQFESALFQPNARGWNNVSTLPKMFRKKLVKEFPWLTVKQRLVLESQKKDTFKALLETADGNQIETVLIKNPRDCWTICVSSQIGCAMRCRFCATGKMGLTRNLLADEIVDQYRYWSQFLHDHPELSQRISNMVFMGMGEPLANYENVREAIRTILKYTDIGRTHITISTVGVLPRLELLLSDPLWPHVRLAISLHSADPKTRKDIVPTSYDDFLPKFSDWSIRYLKRFGNRRHHLTFEYVMLRGVNDSLSHAQAFAKLIKKIGDIRVNLIPYNFTGEKFQTSTSQCMETFFSYLDSHGVTVTKRRTMGEDIVAACGQLYAEESINITL
jgi:23S rRNA (adenine2503-C2)-methyltransferase